MRSKSSLSPGGIILIFCRYVKEARQAALEREEGWSSGGEDSDGGAPIVPSAPGTKKPVLQQPKKNAQYVEGPCRKPTQNSAMELQNQRNDESKLPAAGRGNQLASSFKDWRRGAEIKTSVQAVTRQGSISTAVKSTTSISTPTTSVLSPSPGSRDVVDLVKKTKLFTIESAEPPKENKRGGDEW